MNWLLTLLFTVLGLGIVAWALLDPRNYHTVEPFESAFTLFLGNITGVRAKGFVYTMPWENIVIRDKRQQRGSIPVSNLVTGKGDAKMMFGIDFELVFHIADVVKSVYGFKGDLQEGLTEQLMGAVNMAVLEIGGNVLTDDTILRVHQRTLQIYLEKISAWGVTIDSLNIERVTLPQYMIDAQAILAESTAKADALLRMSKAEVRAYEEEFRAQGKNYKFHQLLDALREMAEHGAFKYVGSLNDLAGVRMTEQMEETP